LPLMSQMGQ